MNISKETSLFKFSKITKDDFNVGAALFTLSNLGKLLNKDKPIIVQFVKEICIKYLEEHGIYQYDIDYSPPQRVE